MSKLLNDLNLLEAKLESFVLKYEFLVQENEVLRNQILELELKKTSLESEIKTKNKSIEDLKLLKSFEGSKEEKTETKRKINALIREIDKCIIQLNH